MRTSPRTQSGPSWGKRRGLEDALKTNEALYEAFYLIMDLPHNITLGEYVQHMVQVNRPFDNELTLAIRY
jgi:hypothetical protein